MLLRSCALIFSTAALLAVAPPVLAQTETVRVDVKLRTGGALTGPVVDHNDHGLVIVQDKTPYVFAWSELVSGNACAVYRTLRVFERGDEKHLTAADYLAIGELALAQGRSDLAAGDLRRAKRLDSTLAPRIEKAYRAFRRRRESRGADPVVPVDEWASDENRDESRPPHKADRTEETGGDPMIAVGPLSGRPEDVLAVYQRFGEKAREVLGSAVQPVESRHFLILTDWERIHHKRLTAWCEAMYDALVEQFDLDPGGRVFLSKCPVFAFQSRRRFVRFAREFDGYEGVSALGYTRSIEANGHVHVALLRQGRAPEDFDCFACTLVHEGTHAFVHRLYDSHLIPHWVNEGMAELTAERVLGARCPNGENATLLARQFVRYDWPIGDWLAGAGPIEVHQYPLAHSVILYLQKTDRGAFNAFVRDLKQGAGLTAALARNYDGVNLEQLEAHWRDWVAARDPAARRAESRLLSPDAP